MFKNVLSKNMAFKIEVRPLALMDTYKIIDWYSERSKVLGNKFYKQLKKHYKSLEINPFFVVRYKNVRCLPMRGFPYMIHFIIDEIKYKIVIIGIISTSRDPQIWEDRLS